MPDQDPGHFHEGRFDDDRRRVADDGRRAAVEPGKDLPLEVVMHREMRVARLRVIDHAAHRDVAGIRVRVAAKDRVPEGQDAREQRLELPRASIETKLRGGVMDDDKKRRARVDANAFGETLVSH